MAFVDLSPPPGVVKRGTAYSAKGRWGDANLWRFRSGAMMPVGGWQPRSAAPISGRGRAMLTWRDNTNAAWIAIGSEVGLFVQDRGGAVYNITPSPFTAGRADAIAGGGYGSGPYGAGAYGQPTPDLTQVQDATTWSLDTFGPYLIGVSTDDGNLVQWQLSTSTPAAKITSSPPCSAAFVTNEHMIMTLGANNDPRQVAWCDQNNNTLWTASNTNTAGKYELTTQGRLMCGRRAQGANLIWTDTELWIASNLQNLLVYGFYKVGDGCGIISRGAPIVINSQAVWMGYQGFYIYNGVTAEPLSCDVLDGVFNNINIAQCSKVVGFYNSLFDECWWLYPSRSSGEIDSYVAWSVHENHWSVGKLARTAACDRSVLSAPMMVGTDGIVYQHETGLNWGGAQPYATLNSIEVGLGDRVFFARQLIPDEGVAGQVAASFVARFYPEDVGTPFGPYALSARTDVRLTGRELDMTLQAVGASNFRVGKLRIEGTLGGSR